MELAESIKKHGVISPITIEKDELGGYFIVAGERRYRASVAAGLTHIPCRMRTELNPLAAKEIELEENIRREALDWTEEAELMRQIDEVKRGLYGSKMSGDENGKGWTQAKTAESMGVSPATVSQSIKIATLMQERPDIKDAIKHLPKNVAMREADRLLKQEELKGKVERGVLSFSSQILRGSCIDLIKSQPDNSVDLVASDPPFGNTEIEDMEGKDRGAVQSYGSLLKSTDNLSREGVLNLLRELIPHLFRVLKPSSHMYLFHTSELFNDIVAMCQKSGFICQLWPIVWYKGRTTAPFRGYDYSPCYEPVLFAHKPPRQKRLNEACKAVIEFPPVPTGDGKIHPFQKPIDLMAYLIKQSTNVGDVVLDPFSGSGSTTFAALDCGRTGIGYEFDEHRFIMSQAALLERQSRPKA